jgi:hypothetical protein
MPLQRISYVFEGQSLSNFFNSSGGAGNDMLSAVYQLFSDNRAADPTDMSSKAQLAELSYNSGLLGEGIGPGGDCTAAEAFEVSDKIWRRFNSPFSAMPGLNSTPLYNIFIAPAAAVSDETLNAGGTLARYQPFYFGTVSSCYGGAWIVSVLSSTSTCDTFNEYLDLSASNISNVTFSNPLYGVLCGAGRT